MHQKRRKIRLRSQSSLHRRLIQVGYCRRVRSAIVPPQPTLRATQLLQLRPGRQRVIFRLLDCDWEREFVRWVLIFRLIFGCVGFLWSYFPWEDSFRIFISSGEWNMQISFFWSLDDLFHIGHRLYFERFEISWKFALYRNTIIFSL